MFNDNWYHIAITWDASQSKAKLYINGTSQGTDFGTRTSISYHDPEFVIGGTNDNFGSYSSHVDGLLDEVRIWNDVRTSSEIESNIFQEISTSSTGLAGYWKLNGNSNDSTSNGNDLTAVNSPVYSSLSPYLDSASTSTSEGYNFTKNLISYWNLDETSGSRVDSHGTNNLVDNNTVGYATGVVGNAADFEESNTEYLSISDASQSGLDLTGSMTIAMWVNLERTDQAQIFAYKYDSLTNDRGYNFYWRETTAARLHSCFSETGSNTSCNDVDYIPATSTWTHVVFTYDHSSDTGGFFVNGEQVGSDFSYNISSINDNDEPFWLGNNEYDQTYDGMMDEVAIWNRALSKYEVKVLYSLGKAGFSFPEN